VNLQSARTQLLIILISTIAIGLLAEAGLRAAHVQFDGSFYTADPQLGWSLRPRAEGWQVSEGREFVRINSEGMHDREHAVLKPLDTVRIAVLGNSWTEALQVPLASNFCSVLEKNLSGCSRFSGRKVEVMNFGVSGYSTAQELLLLQARVWKYKPDIVLLAFYTAKDILNNVRRFNNAAEPAQSPYFIYSGGRLVLDDSFRKLPHVRHSAIVMQNVRGEVADRIRLFQTTTSIVRKLKIQTAKATLVASAASVTPNSLDDMVYAPPASPDLLNAWRVTEGMLAMMRDEVRSHGAALWIVTLANRPQVLPDPERRSQILAKLGVPNLDYADERLQQFASQTMLPVISLAHRMSAYAERNHAYLNGFDNTSKGEGHWNEVGHQLAGELIAEDLCSRLPSGDPPGGLQPTISR
jgi:hypothetical protein